MSLGLHRCVVCRDFTLAAPLLDITGWRMHLPCCFQCMCEREVPMELYLRPVHREIGAALWCLFGWGGLWYWSLARR